MLRFAERLADAFAQGEELSVLDRRDRPVDIAAAFATQQEVLESLDFAACGIRLTRAVDGGWISGPLLEGRIVSDRGTLPLSLFRAPSASAGMLLRLGRDVADAADLPGAFTTVQPVLDVADSRYAGGPADALWQVADLAGLGILAVGRPRRATGAALRAAAFGHDITALLRQALADAGFLPAGALVAITTLSDPFVPEAREVLTADISGVGEAVVTIA